MERARNTNEAQDELSFCDQPSADVSQLEV